MGAPSKNANTQNLIIQQETNAHAGAIERLLNIAFGPGRFAKTAERLREGNHPVDELCLVAFEGDQMRASVRFWPIKIGTDDALLLGPLAVDPSQRGKGIGIDLMKAAIEKARTLGTAHILLVGDEPYYARVGFQNVDVGSITLPGPVDPNRILLLGLQDTEKKLQGSVKI
jgi:predicted N-acetyltransferase YhbS